MEKDTLKDMPFGVEKLKTFWHYYKWHILIGLLILAGVTALVVRCAVNKEADLNIYWAGPVYYTGDAQKEISNAFKKAIPDDCAKTVGMVTTVYGQDVRYSKAPKENEQVAYDYVGKTATLEEFKNQMRLPNTVICLLSPACFRIASEDGQTLRPLSEVLDELPAGTTENGYGIVLSSLPFYRSDPALQQFPEDTVLCLKNKSDFRAARTYDKAVAAFVAIVDYKN